MPRPVRPARQPRAVSLEELSQMSNISNQPESEDDTAPEGQTPETPAPAFAPTSQTARRAAARAEAAAATNPEILSEDTEFTVTDSQGNSIVHQMQAGERVRQHAHVPRAIGVCVLCHRMQEHEASIRPARERVLDQDEEFQFQIPNPAYDGTGPNPPEVSEYLDITAVLAAGQKEKLLNADGTAHDHVDMPRTPSCAYCMAVFDAVRANRPARQARTSTGTPSGTPRECRCLCGGMTRGGRYLPGHDARLAGRVKRFQEFLEDNRDALATGEVTLAEFAEFDKMPADIIEHAQSPASVCSCCGVPLLEPHESGMGPRCRAGLCNCNREDAEAEEATESEAESTEEEDGSEEEAVE